MGAMFALWPFNPERSLMILVSGSIADFSWTLEAAWLTVCRHHVLFGSRSGQTHSFTYTHIHTPAPPAPPVSLIPKHVTQQTWDLVILPTSQAWAQHSGSCCSDLPWWNLQNPLSPSSSFTYCQYSNLQRLCFSCASVKKWLCHVHRMWKWYIWTFPAAFYVVF